MHATGMGRRRCVAAAGLAIGAMALAACGGDDDEASGASSATDAKESFTIALDNGAGANLPWNKALERGVKAKADEIGGITIGANLDGKGDVQTEANNVRAIIGQKPDGVIMYTGNGAQATRLVDQLTAADIKVVALHFRVGSNEDVKDPQYVYPELAGQVLVDEVAAGKIAADLVRKAVPDGGEVGVVTGIPGFVEVGQRLDGFRDGLKGSDVRIVADQPGNFSPQDAEKACAGMLSAHPELAAIYLQADIMVPGCVKAVDAAGSDAKLVGMGGSAQGISLLESGDMYATICYTPQSEAEAAMELMHKVLSAGDAEAKAESVVLPTPPVTKATIQDCKPQYDN